MKRIFYIMGKSSSGKDTIYRRILEEFGFKPIVLYTTRPMRENEQEGREYHFVDRSGFLRMKAAGSVIEERHYDTVYGEWIYFTARESIDTGCDCLGIGTLESYVQLKKSFGEQVVPIYVEVEDGIRLARAVERERGEKEPKYAELCRRFLSDTADFSEERITEAGGVNRFSNNDSLESCIGEICGFIREIMSKQ